MLRRVVLSALLFAALACTRREPPKREPPKRLPVEASPFVCSGATCVQRHVRLPDDGGWRCAERDGVVWCAGGEPAAGVVTLSSGRGYRCGERRGAVRERVCVDVAPDYPDGGPGAFRCKFEQERGVVRTCTRGSGTPRRKPLATEPNCWVDADCAGRCERGSCAEAG